VSTPGPAGAWLEAERANLHAAADDAAGQARSPYAIAIPAAIGQFLAARGHWDQFAALHQTALAAARQAGDQLGEAYTLAELGLLRREAGDYPAAAASLARAVALFGEAGDLPGQGYVLTQLGVVHVVTGDYPAAAASLHQALALARSAGDRPVESEALCNLGTLQQLTGDYPAAAASHQQALALARDRGDLLGQRLRWWRSDRAGCRYPPAPPRQRPCGRSSSTLWPASASSSCGPRHRRHRSMDSSVTSPAS
jgi:tetratricopeptide (TPR) repeat protein